MGSSILISWKTVDNAVVDRMIDDSLNHMFSQHRKIRRKTKIFNREFKQLSTIKSYKKYIKIRNAVLKVVSDDDDTTEDCLSNNDLNDAYQLVEPADEPDDSDNENECNKQSNNNENEINGEKNESEAEIESEIKNNEQDSIERLFDHDNYSEHEDNENISSVSSPNDLIDNKLNITEEEIKSEESPKCETKRFLTKEDVKRNLSDEIDKSSNITATDNVTTPKDSGIDDDSLDSSEHTDTSEIKIQNEITEKSDVDNHIPTSPRKCQPIIKSTEIVTSKYKIILHDANNQNDNDNDDEKLLDNSFENQITKNPSVIAIASEAESLKYILSNLTEHNCYENDFFIDDYCQDRAKENEPDNSQESYVEYTRPEDLEDLVENDDLIEDDTESTLTFEDITEDDEIILMEIPKSIIDNRELKGTNIQIKKRSVSIDGIKYETYRKPNENLSCVWKMRANDSGYELGFLTPRRSIVIRQELSQPKIESQKLISDAGASQNLYAPFPSNLKRRNPLVSVTDCYNDIKRKRENI